MVFVGRILIVGGLLGTCGYAAHEWRRRREVQARDRAAEQARARMLEECLDGVWSERRPLIADVTNDLEGPADTKAHSDNGRLVEVWLTPVAQRGAWAMARFLATEGQTQDREGAIQAILSLAVAPRCDWSQAWRLYEDERFKAVYEGVTLLLDLAELSLKYAPRGTAAGRGAVLSPGWVHEQPVPTADVRPGDYIEVLLDEFSADPDDDSRHAEWAWVRVESIAKASDALVGSITHDAPPGKHPNLQRNTVQHGFGDGNQVSIPRRCIFCVVPGR